MKLLFTFTLLLTLLQLHNATITAVEVSDPTTEDIETCMKSATYKDLFNYGKSQFIQLVLTQDKITFNPEASYQIESISKQLKTLGIKVLFGMKITDVNGTVYFVTLDMFSQEWNGIKVLSGYTINAKK